MAKNTRFFRSLTLLSYFGLLIWLPCWYFILSDDDKLTPLFIGLILIAPLLLPIKGLLKGSPYTHAWTNFIVMFYLMHGLTSLYTAPSEWLYALIELVFATALFIGCSFYARLRGKELGMGIKKLKHEMAEEKAFFESEAK